MRAQRAPAVAIILLGVGAASCSNGATSQTGTNAYMQMPGAQFMSGPMPAGSSSGPGVAQLSLVNNEIWPGFADDPIGGDLDPMSTAAAVGLQGDVGYWIRVAGVPNYTTPSDPTFTGTMAFSLGIVVGTYTLVVHAVDNAGNFGPPSKAILTAELSPTNPPAKGDLVVTLTWDTESNLALHVVDPNGTEIYPNSPSSEPPFPFNQNDSGSYGFIDYNSNANCVIDGLRREDAIWPDTPPSGPYTVRVDTPSLCGQAMADWEVRVFLYGREIGNASGIALETDTMGSHGVGSGVLALQFTVP
jgi:hypothetical protein